MTVEELINILSHYSPNLLVLRADNSGEHAMIHDATETVEWELDKESLRQVLILG